MRNSRPAPARRVHATVLLLMLQIMALLLPAMAADDEQRVIILRPRPTEVLVGESVVALLFPDTDDDQIEEVRIMIDGEPLGVLEAPPWRVSFDAGDDLQPRTIDVSARLVDGRTLQRVLKTRPAGVGQVEVRIVDLAVTVTDGAGRTVSGLRQADFSVFDGGRPVQIDRFGDKPAQLAVALVLDTSLSIRSKLRDVKRAAEAFLQALAPGDRAAVVSFNERSDVAAPLSAERRDAQAAVSGLEALGGTALYDALFDSSKLLDSVPAGERRIAVVLSDGRDESASGLEPGSFHKLQEAVRAAHDADVVVFTIGLGPNLNKPDFSGRMTHEEALRRMATSTGGRYFALRSVRRLKRAYDEILDELRHQYYIAYRPPEARPGEKWRGIEIRVARPGLQVRTREGYFVE